VLTAAGGKHFSFFSASACFSILLVLGWVVLAVVLVGGFWRRGFLSHAWISGHFVRFSPFFLLSLSYISSIALRYSFWGALLELFSSLPSALSHMFSPF
jgi:hypothetical protein